MHLLVPCACDPSEAARSVLHDLALPRLARFLQDAGTETRHEADEHTLTPPHEHALAAVRGWSGSDGRYPFAAHAAVADGVDPGDRAWGLVTPCHWLLGRDAVRMGDPAALGLDDGESRALLASLAPGFEAAGCTLRYGAPLRWYAAHEAFATLACASLDRVIGRDVGEWLPTGDAETRADADARAPARTDGDGAAAAGAMDARRLVARLQSEAQLVLYRHPVNDARDADGRPGINSFWLSGCGRAQPVRGAEPTVDDRLRPPLLAGDWPAWSDAWRALDDGPIAALVGHDGPATLTLCGMRSWSRHARPARTSAWQRFRRRLREAAPAAVLQSL